MKAAVLQEFGSILSVEIVPDPVLGTGEVIVDVVAAPVLPYAKEVFSGERRYLLTLPAVPGCGAVGRVRAVGPDATQLAVGDWVLCDPTVRSRDNVVNPDITLQGWSARDQGGVRLQRYFHDGPFAEQIEFRPRMLSALVLSRRARPRNGVRSSPFWCRTVVYSQPNCRPERRFL